jgi:hypothetical protein
MPYYHAHRHFEGRNNLKEIFDEEEHVFIFSFDPYYFIGKRLWFNSACP